MDVVPIAVIIVLILITLWWVLRPLWQADEDDLLPASSDNQQPLEELYHRRDAAYAAIKDLELDLVATKVSPEDYKPLYTRLTLQAADILRQIDHVSQVSDESLETEIDTLLNQFQTDQPVADEALRDYIRRQIEDNVSINGQYTCPNCQNVIPLGDVFCSQCGTSLGAQCPNCKASAQLGDLFCSQCGVRLGVEAAE